MAEILVTVAVLSGMFVAILSFYSASFRQSLATEARIRAKYLVEREMERFKSLDFRNNELAPFNSFLGDVKYYEQDEYIIKSNIVFLDPTTGAIKEPYPLTDRQNTRLVKVAVSAVRKDGLGGQVDMVTYISP